jgi:hypothetical protein
VIRDAGTTPQLSRRLAGVFETLWLRRAASRAAGVGFFGEWTASEALAPARGTALGALLGAGCWVVVAALAWTLAG